MKFEISRIHTKSGIFRLSGILENGDSLRFKTVELMGTDGWRNFDFESSSGQTLMSEIREELLDFLKSRG